MKMILTVFSKFSGTKNVLRQLITVQLATMTLCSVQRAQGAKILFYIGASTPSHRVALQPLASKLSESGHEITFLSPNKAEVKNPKIKDVCPQGLIDFTDQMNKGLRSDPVVARMKDRNFNPVSEQHGAVEWDLSYEANVATVRSQDFKQWVNHTKFDLVITEHPGKEVALGIAHRHGAKVIAFSPWPLMSTETDTFGIPAESSWYSTWNLATARGYFPHRFYHEFNTIMWHLKYKYSYLPRVDSLLKETFNKDLPHVDDLIKNINLYFLNTHFSNDYAKSFPPFVVPVGGMHVQDEDSNTTLPKEIDDFINAGDNNGFIYISFGSVLKVSALPYETRKSFFDAIDSFKNTKFVLKWNDDIPEDIPANILPMKWFPQQELLAHPKCRGFISQGGLMSYQQATYHGVPMVIVPVIRDQPSVALTAVHQGIGIHLELADITYETFSDAIRQLLYNESFSTRAKEVARRFKDRPMTPVDTAAWWTEYVLRHENTDHLKPLGIHQEWWQRRQVDFWATIFTIVAAVGVVNVWAIYSFISWYNQPQKESPIIDNNNYTVVHKSQVVTNNNNNNNTDSSKSQY